MTPFFEDFIIGAVVAGLGLKIFQLHKEGKFKKNNSYSVKRKKRKI